MEESTQRRERLKAMRMEASQEDANATYNNDHSAVSLSNPLLESTTNSESPLQTTSQSFNYYTNPMAAYSGNKQRSQVSPQMPQNFSSTPRSPNPQMQQPQSSTLPNPRLRGNSPQPRGYNGPRGVGFPSPGQGGYPSPHFANSPGHGSGRGYPSPGPNFRNSPNHGSGQEGYPTYPSPGPSPHFTNAGQGSGRGYPSHGPDQGKGYGSGPSYGRGRGSGQGGGRGRGHNHVTAEDRPDRFFNRSMVEDPWKFLEPVVWKSLKKQWFSPVNAKKARVSESPRPSGSQSGSQPSLGPSGSQSGSQPSLAEILAASFNEAVEDEPDAE